MPAAEARVTMRSMFQTAGLQAKLAARGIELDRTQAMAALAVDVPPVLIADKPGLSISASAA